MTGLDSFSLPTVGFLFAGYLLGVWLLEVISARLRSIAFIKTVHTLVFLPLSALLAIFVYEVVSGRIGLVTWIAVALFLAESVVLLTHRWRCPLTIIAETLGSTHGRITDIFLPKWFADRVFPIYGTLFVVGILFLIVRLWFAATS